MLVLAAATALPVPSAERERQPVPVEPAGDPVELTGWLTDEWCGAGNANVKGADCVRQCVSKGASLVFFSAGKIYRLAESDGLQRHIGREVRVEGRLERDGRLRIDSIRPRERDEDRGAMTARN